MTVPMAVETDGLGNKLYTEKNTDIVRVVPVIGGEYTISPLETSVHNNDFPSWILEPEEPIIPELTVFAYGLGESGAICSNEANAIAALGMPVALHDTPRKDPMPSMIDILRKPELGKEFARRALNPLILPSEAAEQVVDAAQAYSPRYQRIIVKARSMGGVSGSMHAVHDEDVSMVYYDGSAGVVLRNALANHGEDPLSLLTDEAYPAAKFLMHHKSHDTVERIKKHFTDDITRLPREMGFLLLKRPDISGCLELLKNRGVTTIAVTHELDKFFKDRDTQFAVQALRERGLISLHKRSKGTRHVHGIEKPLESAEMYRSLVLQARSLASPAKKVASAASV